MSTFDDEIAARTIWGEARGESYDAKCAVAHVIRNRAKALYRGKTVASVCLAPSQFSCWNEDDPNRRKILEADDRDGLLGMCRLAWEQSAHQPDPTGGSRHYKVVGTPAKWADGKTPSVTIGHHEFFVGIA